MNPTLSYLLGRRMWWVPGVAVWGQIADFEPEIILSQVDGASKRIVHGKFAIGGSSQTIRYADLLDSKGNPLPETLTSPRVMAQAKGEIGVIVQGEETAQSFVLAKTQATDQLAVADLLIVEMG